MEKKCTFDRKMSYVENSEKKATIENGTVGIY